MAKTRTIPYHPTSNGLKERFNRTIISVIQKAVNEEEDDWDGHLPKLLMYYHSSVHSSTGYTPFPLMLELFHHCTKCNMIYCI